MVTFWDNFGELFKHAQEAAREQARHEGKSITPTVFARLTKEEFRLSRVAEDAADGLRESAIAMAGRVERYEDALWEIIQLARDQEKLIEHRRSQNESVSDVDVARWLAFRKASKKAAEALGVSVLEV
jgi:hypothetical protein